MPNVPQGGATPPPGTPATADAGWNHLMAIMAKDAPAKLTRGHASRQRIRNLRRGR